MPAVGGRDLGERGQVVLVTAEEPEPVPVADVFVGAGAADHESVDAAVGHAEPAGRAASRFSQFVNGHPLGPDH